MKNDLIAIRKKLDALKYQEDLVNDKIASIEKIANDFYSALEKRFMADPKQQRVKLVCFIRQVADSIAPGEICSEVKEKWDGRDEKSYLVVVINVLYKPTQQCCATWKVDLATKRPPYLVSAAEIVEKINKGLAKLKIQ